jgi:hypothetical protein
VAHNVRAPGARVPAHGERAPDLLPRLSADPISRFTRLADADREAGGKRGWVRLAEAFACHLDGVSAAHAWQTLCTQRPELADTYRLCALQKRSKREAAAALGVDRSTISRRLRAAQTLLQTYLGVCEHP